MRDAEGDGVRGERFGWGGGVGGLGVGLDRIGVLGFLGVRGVVRFSLRGGVASGGGGGVCAVDCEARGVRRGCLTLAGGLRLRDGFGLAGGGVAVGREVFVQVREVWAFRDRLMA